MRVHLCSITDSENILEARGRRGKEVQYMEESFDEETDSESLLSDDQD